MPSRRLLCYVRNTLTVWSVSSLLSKTIQLNTILYRETQFKMGNWIRNTVRLNRSTPTKYKKRGHSRAWHFIRNAKKRNLSAVLLSRLLCYLRICWRSGQCHLLLSKSALIHTIPWARVVNNIRERCPQFFTITWGVCGFRDTCKSMERKTLKTVEFWPRK